MKRKSAVLLLLLLSSLSAFAFTGRPVSDLRFGFRLADRTVSGAATDGSDFFMVLSLEYGGEVRGQLVRQGLPAGPAFFIADGTNARVVWTGSIYVVGYRTDSGIWLARVSRGGALLEAPRLVLAGSMSAPKLVTNGKRTLIGGTDAVDNTSEFRAVLLDGDGYALSGPVTLAYWPDFAIGTYDIAGAGDGFALLMYGYKATRVVRYDANGIAINRDGTLLEPLYDGTYSTTSYHSLAGVISGHGDNAVVLFTTGFPNKQFVELKTAVIGPRGEMVQPTTTVRSMPVSRVGLTTLQWDGSAFTGFATIDDGPLTAYSDSVTRPALLRVNADGSLLQDLAYVTSGSPQRVATAAAIGGDQTLAAWYEITTDRQKGIGPAYVLVPRGGMTPGTPVPVGETANTCAKIATNAMGSQQLAAWVEQDAEGWALRASRLDANANYLDGAGILLTRLPALSPYHEYVISIDNDGARWLVTWAGGSVRGARIDATGRLLDPTPINISYGSEVSVRWTGETYLVVSAEQDLMLTVVSGDGVVGASRKIAAARGDGTQANPWISWRQPAIVCDSQWCLAGSMRHSINIPEYSVQPVPYPDAISLTAVPLDHRGGFAGDTFTIAEQVSDGTPAVASSGNSTLFLYQRYEGQFAAVFPAGTTAGAKIIRTDNPLPATLAATFDGYDYILASLEPYGAAAVTTQRMSPAGTLFERRHVLFDGVTALQSPSLAASTNKFPLLTYIASDAAVERRAHAFSLFLPELDATAPAAPAPPSRPRATRLSSERVLVRWDPLATAPFGYSIEVRVNGGGWRQMAIAPAGATEAIVPLEGVEALGVRLRAWNRAGMSDASAEGAIAPAVTRAVRR